MSCKQFIFLSFLINIAFAVTFVDSCVNISASGVYELNASLSGNQSNGVCVYVNASDVVLDGKGYSIVGNSSEANVSDDLSTVGVFADLSGLSNFTVKNLFVKNYSTDVRVYYGTSVTVFNNTFSYGLNRTLLIGGTVNANVSGNTFFNTTRGDLVRASSVHDSLFEGNEFNQGSGVLLYDYYPVNVTVFNNSFNDSGSYGVYNYYGWNDSVEENFFNNTGGIAVYFNNERLGNISGNEVRNPGASGLYAYYGYDNLIDNNSVYNAPKYGILLYSLRTNVTDNYIYHTTLSAIRLAANAENNAISGNVIDGVIDYNGIETAGTIQGVHVFNNTFKDMSAWVGWANGRAVVGSDGWIIENNTVTWSAGAIYKDYGITGGVNGIVRNNHIYGGGKRGIYEANHNNVTIENNLIEDCTEYGVFIVRVNNSIVSGNNITNAAWGAGVFNLTNMSFENNRITGSTNGVLINQSAFSNNFTNNYLGVTGKGVEIDYLSNDNLFENNSIIGAGSDLIIHEASENAFKNITLNSFKVSLTGFSVNVTHVPSPEADPLGFRNLQKYFSIRVLGSNAWAEVNTSYDESSLSSFGIENESNLTYLYYNGSDWKGVNSVVVGNNDYVSYNFSNNNFSVGLFGKYEIIPVNITAPGMEEEGAFVLFFMAVMTVVFVTKKLEFKHD